MEARGLATVAGIAPTTVLMRTREAEHSLALEQTATESLMLLALKVVTMSLILEWTLAVVLARVAASVAKHRLLLPLGSQLETQAKCQFEFECELQTELECELELEFQEQFQFELEIQSLLEP